MMPLWNTPSSSFASYEYGNFSLRLPWFMSTNSNLRWSKSLCLVSRFLTIFSATWFTLDISSYYNKVWKLKNYRFELCNRFVMSNKMKEASQEKPNPKSKTCQPLLTIPSEDIIVYNDRIEIGRKQQKIKSFSTFDTNPTLTEIPSSFRQISFSQTDIVFKLVEKDKKFLLSKIYNCQKPFLQIHINSNQDRQTMRRILRKRWCEAGFEEQFEVKEEIGKGAMANVFLISRREDGRLFAAKVISLKIECEKSYDTFINQTRILRVLNSPHVVALEGVYISHKKELIEVLEYLNGGTLFTELKQRKLITQKDKLKAVKDITLGLEHLRQKRIVHRDLKLENIMIRNSQNGQKQYVITDFGLSNWIGERKILFEKCGTPGYLAPQIFHQKKGVCLLTHSTDVFSLGIIYHYIYMNCGIFPFDGCPKRLLEHNKNANFNLTDASKRLTERQFNLIAKTLNVDPAQRPTTKQILQNYIPDLQEFLTKREKLSLRQNSLMHPQTKMPQYQTPTIHEERLPSYRKKNITVTEVSKKKTKSEVSEQRGNKTSRTFMESARNAFTSAVNRISSSFSREKKGGLKSKSKAELRQEMKTFVE